MAMAETEPAVSQQDVEETLLGGRRRYTRGQAAGRADVSIAYASRLWQALGFAELPDDEVAFTDGDVAALRKSRALIESGLIDEERAIRLARATGQTMARLAEWQTDTLLEEFAVPGAGAETQAVAAMELAERLVGEYEELLVHVWRRQLAAAGTRALAVAGGESSPATVNLAVGFADLVGFTRLTRQLDDSRLAAVVEEFETSASDMVAAHGGRLVKTVGDEVLFVADTAPVCAEIALALAANGGAGVTDVRIGLAYGPVLPRMGDVFGTTVNLASRLTSFARPGTVLVDRRMAAQLDASAYQLIRIMARRARGLGLVQPYVLRRSPATPPGAPESAR